ncbi:MAG: tetratricopeptide repeat protein [Saprospiraceae bacterium]|nr:tetratricopeptide repeat protein [Saprospiraceae bacterium]
MAKLIPYKPDTERKLGFRKVRKLSSDASDGQLELFHPQRDIQKLRHLDPFEKGLQIDEKNEELAEKLYLEAIRSAVSVADSYCNLGIIYARKGNTVDAIDCFTKALGADPRHTEAHYNLANMYYDAGNYTLALTHYELAMRMDDSFAEVAYNLALTYLCLNNRAEAVNALEKYIGMVEGEEQNQAHKLIRLLQS